MVNNLLRSIVVIFAIALLPSRTLAQAQLSEVERLRWELAAVRSQLHAALAERDACRVQIVPTRGEVVKSELAQLKAAIEAAHPGYLLNLQTGQLEPKPKGETEKR